MKEIARCSGETLNCTLQMSRTVFFTTYVTPRRSGEGDGQRPTEAVRPRPLSAIATADHPTAALMPLVGNGQGEFLELTRTPHTHTQELGEGKVDERTERTHLTQFLVLLNYLSCSCTLYRV